MNNEALEPGLPSAAGAGVGGRSVLSNTSGAEDEQSGLSDDTSEDEDEESGLANTEGSTIPSYYAFIGSRAPAAGDTAPSRRRTTCCTRGRCCSRTADDIGAELVLNAATGNDIEEGGRGIYPTDRALESTRRCSFFAESVGGFVCTSTKSIIGSVIISGRATIEFFLGKFLWIPCFPLRGLLYKCVAGYQGTVEEQRYYVALCIWTTLFATAAYGIFQDLRAANWSTHHFLQSRNDIYIVVARASGKLATVFLMGGLLFTLRPFTSAINEIPHYRRHSRGWRRIHVDLIILSIVFASIHSTMQLLRMMEFPTDATYELYFLVTALCLWLIFAIQSLPHIVMNLQRQLAILPDGTIEFWKRIFRLTHDYYFPAFMVAYCIHSSGSVFPIVLLVAWMFVQNTTTFRVTKAYFRETGEGEQGTTILLIHVDDCIPFEFGVYCKVVVAGMFGSYTMIPLAHRDSNEEGTWIQFIIKSSVLTKALHKAAESDRKLCKSRYRRKKLFGRKYITLPINELGLVVYGPYHSTDMGIKDGKCKILVVMSTESGKAVAEIAVKFALEHLGFWPKLIIVQACGRREPDEAVRKSHRISDCTDPCDILADFRIAEPELRANEVWRHICRSLPKLDEGHNEPRRNPNKKNRHEKSRGIQDQRIKLDAGTKHPEIVSYQLYGELTAAMMRKFIRKVERGAAQKVHYLVCSSLFHKLLESADDTSANERMDNWARVHIEEFQ
jgi:hypothetical protein